MKAVVAAFNQEKALVASRGLLRAYESSDGTFSSTSRYGSIPKCDLCRAQVVRGAGVPSRAGTLLTSDS